MGTGRAKFKSQLSFPCGETFCVSWVPDIHKGVRPSASWITCKCGSHFPASSFSSRWGIYPLPSWFWQPANAQERRIMSKNEARLAEAEQRNREKNGTPFRSWIKPDLKPVAWIIQIYGPTSIHFSYLVVFLLFIKN